MRPMSLKANELLTEVSQGSAVLSMKKQIAEEMEQLDESHCAAKRPAGSAPEGERGRSQRLREQERKRRWPSHRRRRTTRSTGRDGYHWT